MSSFSRMPRYDVRNDGAGPYGVFYCDSCEREFRSQPDVINTVAQDFGKQALGGLLRKVPLVGNTVANNVTGEDPRYSYKLTPAQLESAWKQVQVHFRECPTCGRVVCLSDFDTQSGYCNEDSPRTNEISEARGEQAGAAIKGFASAFGLGDVVKKVSQAAETAKQAATQLARCPNDGTLAPAGTKVLSRMWRSNDPTSAVFLARTAMQIPKVPNSVRNAALKSSAILSAPSVLRAVRMAKERSSARIVEQKFG